MKTQIINSAAFVRIGMIATAFAVSIISTQSSFAAEIDVRRQQANVIRDAIAEDLSKTESIATPSRAIPALRVLVRLFSEGAVNRNDALLVVRLAVDLSETDPTMSFRSTLVQFARHPALVQLMRPCRVREDGFPDGDIPAPVDRGPELANQDEFARSYQIPIDQRVRAREVCEVKNMIDEHHARRRNR